MSPDIPFILRLRQQPTAIDEHMKTVSRPPCTVLAFAITQMFALSCAHAQSADNVLPAVEVTSSAPTGNGIAGVGSFSDTPLREVPASISVITLEQMQERSIRTATDAVIYDASVQNSYNAVGLADMFAIRGYVLDFGSSYRKDGLPILAHSMIPLENKERFEVLKGLAGLQSGIASAGGILNYVVKRPTNAPLRSVTLEASERGTIYAAVDLGGRSDDKRFGYRINAAGADIKSYVQGSNGDRKFVSGAFDWRLSPKALLQVDLDYHHKSQLTVPGFQLLGPDNIIPTGVSGKTMLNNQPWSLPVTDDTSNVGIKFEYELNENWRTTLQANQFTLHRDDAVALASGCGNANLATDPLYVPPAGCGNTYVGYNANGDYAVYDLRRDNDKRSVLSTQAMLQGKFATGVVKHDLTIGIATVNRRDTFANYLFDFKGYSNIYNPVVVPATLGPTLPVNLRRKDEERSIFTQDILSLNDKLKLHAGVRYTQLQRDQFNAGGTQTRRTDDSFLLPSVALVFSPQSNWSIYGSYAEGLEAGGEAPAGTNNVDMVLDPSKSKQFEIGVKADISTDLSVAAALFQIRRSNEYINSAFDYLVAGDAVHRGLELSAQGRATRNLTLGASVTALQATTENTGDSQIEGRRVGNVPRLKSAVYASYALPQMPNLKLNGTWLYSSDKDFAPNRDLRKEIDAYSVFNVGAQYKTKLASTVTTFRFGVDNVFNKFYWAMRRMPLAVT
jgi:iron complex outermembrane receptor protein